MRYYANPSTPAAREAMSAGLLGFIDTPAQGNVRPPGIDWCADNGCFGKGYPGDEAWLAWLTAQVALDGATCAFATAPDVVGDAQATLARSAPWLPTIRALGVPAAYVAQNGATVGNLPWADFDVLFLGGTVECPEHGARLDAEREGTGSATRHYCPVCRRRIYDWKLGPVPRQLVAEAKRRGMRTHMGRVNTGKRYAYAAAIGCDSADGTTLAKFPNTLPLVLGWVKDHHANPPLFGDIA